MMALYGGAPSYPTAPLTAHVTYVAMRTPVLRGVICVPTTPRPCVAEAGDLSGTAGGR